MMDDHIKQNRNQKRMEVAGVLFAPRTDGGRLVERLRQQEEIISKQCGHRVKIVERAGSKLQDLLTRSDPFTGGDCGRPKCYPCLGKAVSLKWMPCWRVNVTYAAECFRCREEGIRAVYHGESGKSLYHRTQTHMDKLRGWDFSSFMLRHNLQHHPEDDPLSAEYLWYPTGFHERAMDRQVAEAIHIKEELERIQREGRGILMNGKTEYNRCILPGITREVTEEDNKKERKL